uniref:F-box domain-containing protein n=1 Tax=Brassica oleracea var. oleracea TaxID=109376 RepID=A0A0D3BTM2_BRAOL
MSSKTRADNEESSEPLSPITSLPDGIVVDILARVPRHDYPTLSLVSKQFRSLVTSNEIYVRRSLLRCTENCLYVLVSNSGTPNDGLYILRQKANGHRCLVHISSLLDLPTGQRMIVRHFHRMRLALTADCTRCNPSRTCLYQWLIQWLVFSTGKFMYDPKERHRGVVKGLDELLAEISRLIYWKCTVRCGRNLALYFRKRAEEQSTETTRKIWCAEISLGRRQGGDIWGKVEWCDHVLTMGKIFYMKSDKYIYTCKNPPFSHYNAVAIEQ